MKKTLLLSLVCASLVAQETFTLEEQTITASHLQKDELTYAAPVEIYSAKDIENSKSKNIYDFLNQETSVITTQGSGSIFAQKIDMRGYGVGDGYENIVVVVNGRRMNNIDMVPQLLSSIPIDSIEKIEILKGAGSVEYGDGANAGVISITTKDFNGVNLRAYSGNFGTGYGSLGAGYEDELFSFSAFGDYFETDGQRDLEADGVKQDSGRSKSGSFDLKLYSLDEFEFRIGWAATRINTNYANPLTNEQYENDPTQVGKDNWGSTYTNQHFDTDLWSFGFTYDLTSQWSLDTNLYLENKKSDYGSSPRTDYDYNSGDFNVNYSNDNLKIVVGTYFFDGERDGWGKIISKDNLAGFVKADYTIDNHTLTTGLRIEEVTYAYSPTGTEDETLKAYELGYNYKVNTTQSFFASFAHSFQAPNIDRFFDFSGNFNGFIEPMQANTYNIGYNRFTKNNKLKASIFYTDVSNEIYYTGTINTNLDQTSKLGFELYNKYLFTDTLYLSANYTYVKATIEKDDNKNIENKILPGVSKHNLTASVGYAPTQKSKFITSHAYRSSAYALEDFDNSALQKQEAYNSTDITASYQYDEHIELFAKIQNLFDEDNGIWINDDEIYPVNFQRSFQIGLNGKF